LLSKKIKIYDLLYCVLGFIIFNIPALILGRNIFEIIEVYLLQTSEYEGITRSAPNFYSLFNLHYVPIASWIKYALVLITIILSVFIVTYGNKKYVYNNNEFIIKMTFLSLLVPFFLPGMMDRYFYLGNIFFILLLFLFNYTESSFVSLIYASFIAYSLPTLAIQAMNLIKLHAPILFITTLGNMYIIYNILKNGKKHLDHLLNL